MGSRWGHSPITGAHADLPHHALTGGRQAVLFGASCSPLSLTLLGRKGECQPLGAEGPETLSGKLGVGSQIFPSAKFGNPQPTHPKAGEATAEAALTGVGPALPL